MKRLIFAVAAAACCTAGKADVTTLMAAAEDFMATNRWTEADLMDAVKSLRKFYLNRTRTEAGRAEFHGRLVRKVTDAATGKVVSTYEDGEVFEDDAPKARAAATAKRAAVTAAGLPAKLAAQRQAAAVKRNQTNEVNVVVTAGGTGK